ncbi:MAG: bifunctional demethylmenaquinone methyltransferase/2-methoxy-6-polyprenyl-1,4-benzoquinol methylase UbiE [Microbacteriaceae bacterium]
MTSADLGKDPDEVSAMFDDVAPRYDLTNALLSLGSASLWRIATVRALGINAGDRVLDIAAGTGTSSAAIARAGARVTALDFSPGMVAVGRQRHPDIEFIEGDAQQLPFDDASFDAVTISFGLRNVNDPHRALAEMRRVLVPGGRVVICEFTTPPNSLVRGAYSLYLNKVMPSIAALASSNPEAYTYLMKSIAEWPTQGVLGGWMRDAGFVDVGYRNLTAGVVALHRGRAPLGAGQ